MSHECMGGSIVLKGGERKKQRLQGVSGIDKARSVALLLAFVAAGLSGEFFHRGADALNSEECSWQIRK